MKGATEYANLFETGQYGRLYFVSYEHARGECFHIQVLPEGEKAKSNGTSNLCTNNNAVEVFGITGGNPGWTESYGWLHKGAWQADFQKLVEKRKAEIAAEDKEHAEVEAAEAAAEKERIANLLLKYE